MQTTATSLSVRPLQDQCLVLTDLSLIHREFLFPLPCRHIRRQGSKYNITIIWILPLSEDFFFLPNYSRHASCVNLKSIQLFYECTLSPLYIKALYTSTARAIKQGEVSLLQTFCKRFILQRIE